MKVTTKSRKPADDSGAVFDQELNGLPEELRWREWMGRIEAVLFASASPVGREDLARVVGQGASVEMLIDDVQAELTERPYELVQVAAGWMFRTKTQFADAIKAAADLGEQSLAFSEMEMGVLCAIGLSPADRPGRVERYLWQGGQPRSAGPTALQGSDRERSESTATRRAAYVCND